MWNMIQHKEILYPALQIRVRWLVSSQQICYHTGYPVTITQCSNSIPDVKWHSTASFRNITKYKWNIIQVMVNCLLTEQRYSLPLNDSLWSVSMADSLYQHAWECPQAEVHFIHKTYFGSSLPSCLKIVSCCYTVRSAFDITTELLI